MVVFARCACVYMHLCDGPSEWGCIRSTQLVIICFSFALLSFARVASTISFVFISPSLSPIFSTRAKRLFNSSPPLLFFTNCFCPFLRFISSESFYVDRRTWREKYSQVFHTRAANSISIKYVNVCTRGTGGHSAARFRDPFCFIRVQRPSTPPRLAEQRRRLRGIRCRSH